MSKDSLLSRFSFTGYVVSVSFMKESKWGLHLIIAVHATTRHARTEGLGALFAMPFPFCVGKDGGNHLRIVVRFHPLITHLALTGSYGPRVQP